MVVVCGGVGDEGNYKVAAQTKSRAILINDWDNFGRLIADPSFAILSVIPTIIFGRFPDSATVAATAKSSHTNWMPFRKA